MWMRSFPVVFERCTVDLDTWTSSTGSFFSQDLSRGFARGMWMRSFPVVFERCTVDLDTWPSSSSSKLKSYLPSLHWRMSPRALYTEGSSRSGFFSRPMRCLLLLNLLLLR